MYQTIKIAQGDLVLVGPKMNLGGYWTGPHLYYLLAPALFIGAYEISGVLYFHTLLFAASLGFFFYSASKNLDLVKSLLATISLGLLQLFIESSRYPSNGYTYFALLLILCTYVFFFRIGNKRSLLVAGFLTGFIINIHPISLLALIFTSAYIFLLLKNKHSFSTNKKMYLFFLGATFLMFIPSILFELTHDFVMTKDTFINKSYTSFINTSNTPQFRLHENQLTSSIMFISEKYEKLITFSPLVFFALSFFALKFKDSKFLKSNKFIFFSILLSLALLISVLRFHFEDHYIFSVAFFIFFGTILILLRSKLWFFILIIILFQLQSFPKNIYEKQDIRSYKQSEAAVKYAIDNSLVSKNRPFNLIHLTDAYGLVPTGFEYRFFFRKYGFYPNSEYDYKTSKTLLIFSETPFYDIDRFKMWATEEFGRKYFEKREIYHVGNIDIYQISKDD